MYFYLLKYFYFFCISVQVLDVIIVAFSIYVFCVFFSK